MHSPSPFGAGERNKMAHTETQIIGFAEMVLAMLEEQKEMLRKGGLDVDFMIDTLTKLTDEMVRANSEQESAKVAAKEATNRMKTMKRQTYTTTSSYLDMAMGSVDNTSDAARIMRRLRSSLKRRHYNESPEAETAPTPTP